MRFRLVPSAVRYAVAVGITTLTFAVRLALSGVFGEASSVLPFVMSVLVAAVYGGLGPGLLATALGAVLGTYLFVPPFQALSLQPAHVVSLGLFVAIGVTVSLLCEALHAARRRMELEFARQRESDAALQQRDRALQAAQDELRIVTDSMSAPVTRCTADLRYAWVSRPYAQWLGLQPADLIGRRIEEVLGAPAFTALRPHFDRVLAGEPLSWEAPVDVRGLGRRWMSGVYTPTFDAAGHPDGWVGVDVDIDDRKRAEQKLREADHRKDEFLAILAHELRNPLAPLGNSLQIMRLAARDEATVSHARDVMERQLQQLVRLVDDLLDVSRITRGTLELRRRRIEISAVLLSAVEASRPLIEAPFHELSLKLPSESVYVDGDPARLAQVVSNLLNNAAKFTETGGLITLEAFTEGGEVVIRVRDTGAGIPPDMLASVFEMFRQVDSTLERARGGLGIGLTLVKQLVELHGGRALARSDGRGKGSEFEVRLPLAEAPARADDLGADRPEEPRGPSRRVLVVDDNDDAAESLAILLRLMSHHVRVAHDGLTALRMAADEPPEVVLLDIGMPGLNGFEVAQRLREQPWGRSLILIALTGWGQEGDRRRSRQAGFDFHMVKPVDPDALESLLTEGQASGTRPARG